MGTTSRRQEILEGLEGLLTASTYIKTATLDLVLPAEVAPHEYPKVVIIDRGTEHKRLAYPHASAEDMEATMHLEVVGMVHDKNNVLDAKRGDVYRAIVNTVESTTTSWAALVKEARIRRANNDMGYAENIGIVTCDLDVIYYYNHASP